MSSYGVNEVGTGAGGMVYVTSLASGSVTGSGASGCGRRLMSTMSWQRLGDFQKVTEGGLVRRSFDGSEERMWKPSLRVRLRW